MTVSVSSLTIFRWQTRFRRPNSGYLDLCRWTLSRELKCLLYYCPGHVVSLSLMPLDTHMNLQIGLESRDKFLRDEESEGSFTHPCKEPILPSALPPHRVAGSTSRIRTFKA